MTVRQVKDVFGNKIELGDFVVAMTAMGRGSHLNIVEVTELRNGETEAFVGRSLTDVHVISRHARLQVLSYLWIDNCIKILPSQAFVNAWNHCFDVANPNDADNWARGLPASVIDTLYPNAADVRAKFNKAKNRKGRAV